MKKMSRLDVFMIIVFALVFIWIMGSWVEVLSKNTYAGATYSSLNFFQLLLKGNQFFCG